MGAVSKCFALAIGLAMAGLSCAAQTKMLDKPEKGVPKQSSSPSAEEIRASNKDKEAVPSVTVIVHQESSPGNKANENQDDENIKVQRKLASLTRWLVIVGFIQAAILGGTILAVMHQASVAKNIERAWVLVESAAIDPVWGGKSAIRPLLKNVGRTIARIRKISLGGARPLQLDGELPAPPIFEGNQDLDFVLSPNGELPLLYIPIVPINSENMQSVQNGLLKMYVYGRIEYIDFSGKSRVTGFCLIYNWGKNDVPPGFYPYLEAPPGYNIAT